MKKDNLSEQSILFAVEVVKLAKILYEKKEFIISKQLGKSATSIGANIREAQYAQSKADFISKLQIALKESNETDYWLDLLSKTEYITENEYKNLFAMNTSIRLMLISSINTAKSNS